ncbi:MAG TPA: PAS domain-containing protein [Terriglobia bacterium]|nr:PAS domain-containing protein [Terriglobia bacterium]
MMDAVASQEPKSEPMNLQLLSDSIPALIHTGLPNGDLDYFNQTWLNYVGLSLEDLTGWKWTAAVHPDDVAAIVEKWRVSIATGEPFEHEARVRRADGEYRWMFHHKVPLRDERGNIVRWYGTSIDIEDRKRAEERVWQNESELRRLIDAIPQHVMVLEPDGSTRYINQVGLDYTGLTLEESVAKDALAKIYHPDDLERVLGERRNAISRGAPGEVEARILGADGKYRWFLIRINPLRDELGRVLRWYGTRTDIEDRKQAEDALRRSRAYLTQAQSLSHTGSFGWTLSTGELQWSEETFRIFQHDPTTKPTLELVLERVHPEDRALAQQTIERASREEKDFEHEYRLLMPDGSVKYLHIVAHALSDAFGGIEFAGAVMDITAAREAEDRIRRIINTVPGLLWSARPNGWIDFISQRWLDYTGMTLEQALGWGWIPAFHPDDLEQVLSKWQAALAEGKPFEAETRLRRFDGEYRWFIGRAFPLLDVSGQILGWYGGDFDIHDRKLAEERVREQETELRQILDIAPQHVCVLGPDGSRVFLNQAALEYYGLTLEEWQTCDLRQLFHPDDWERTNREVQSALTSGSVLELEARVLRCDGKYRWFLFRYKPLRDDQERIMRWAVAALDIEDRKQAEERLQHENVALREDVDKASMFEEIVGASPALQSVLTRVAKVAPTDSTVLITGETGTGKELIARAIHRQSPRRSRAFVSVNLAALPRDLVASELFGHEKGAFTGAAQRHLGRFELAEGGTIFLDEIGELSAETQIALLRVLQEHEFERVGGTRSLHADVRVIAATNRDIQAAIVAGAFRNDLFYRLNVFPIEIPPLRERREDIPLLVEYFIDRYARKAGKTIRRVNKKSLDLLQSYPWPGNIRELQNIVERSLIVCETENFSVDESWLSRQPAATEPRSQLALSQKLAAQEKEMIEAALRESGGRVYGPSGAAAKLGMPRSTLESKIRSLKINKNRFKSD